MKKIGEGRGDITLVEEDAPGCGGTWPGVVGGMTGITDTRGGSAKRIGTP